MATKQASFIHVDEHFINLELSSSDLASPPNSSPQQNREFEFPTTSVSPEKQSSPSSLADDLFHEGKLLPLHLLNNSKSARTHSTLSDYLFPWPSCPSISPSESSSATSEVNPYKFPRELNGFTGDPPKKYWSKKLKQMIKQSKQVQRLEASRAYVQSLFRKYDCSDKSCVSASNNSAVSEKKQKIPSEVVDDTRHQSFMKSVSRELIKDYGVGAHSRSFSGGIRHSGMKSWSVMSSSSVGSLSSSFSLSSSPRSSSANSERESWIEGAIAHCKQYQQKQCASTKLPDDVRICLDSASTFAI